jgi:hypothetical protein
MMKNAIEKVVVNSSFGKLATNSPEFNDKVLPEIEESFSGNIEKRRTGIEHGDGT